MKIALVFVSFAIVHILVWFSTNLQLIKGFDNSKALYYCIFLAIPTSVSAFFATKFAFEHLESAWSIRLFGHGTSYLIFPVLTWLLLHETPFNAKTMICIGLSMCIVFVQVFYPN